MFDDTGWWIFFKDNEVGQTQSSGWFLHGFYGMGLIGDTWQSDIPSGKLT